MSQIIVRRVAAPPDDAVFVIHMGAGAVDVVVAGALRNHDDYIGVVDDLGRFTISVFAVTDGITETDILSALPQGQFGRTTFGDLRQHRVAYLATTIVDDHQPADMANLQRVHFDLIIPVRSPVLGVTDLVADQLNELRAGLAGAVANILDLFVPRERK